MAKFNIPTREYSDGPKKMVSMRLPEKLIDAIDRLAKKKGWNTTDLVTTVLDQYIQYEKD
jgi:predicted DNA binding CopG/RHH family protein